MGQQMYAALWDYPFEIRTGLITLDEANKLCRQRRAAAAKRYRAEGKKVKCWTLHGQLRPYWGFDNPCGMTCPGYMLNVD